jgi:oligopeptide/dipeptide ABC transporter ATP-binding protein
MEPLLGVHNIRVNYRTERGFVRAVDDVSFSLRSRQNLALVGESGCGKTTVAKAILHLLADNASISGGEITFQGREIHNMREREFDRYRWREISVISQSAMNALNPVYTVGDQIVEAIQAHERVGRRDAQERVRELFQWVGLSPERIRAYPHEFSGGMKQRVIIAMSLALGPSLIIADEPTTALDVIMQDQILERIVSIQRQSSSSILMISHDISVVTEVCQHIVVMYAGKVMESCSIEEFYRRPCHPYSMGLLMAFPTLEGEAKRLVSISGFPPNLLEEIDGCLFRDRCPFQRPICGEIAPPDVEIAPGHVAKCHFAHQADELRYLSTKEATWEGSVA